ncbi:hypothetical protein [Chelativorans sp. Marseille-P2723]|uniref:hypothetical protein n=1 Tax=Chelativorans sp. Marseille-P2723 TaxID=2709133 RepID=UPI00156DFFE1|nr:hypothetical protein [Chelativorans sp. Marseille-P2723]
MNLRLSSFELKVIAAVFLFGPDDTWSLAPEDKQKMTNDSIGVDISKANLDAYRVSEGTSRRFTNDGAATAPYCHGSAHPIRAIYEPAGPLSPRF